jgi:pSer/pThr/pTyr-binding forkhead associated (FHA) protein
MDSLPKVVVMTADSQPILARLVWVDPVTNVPMQLLLAEGDTITIGRMETNTICIKQAYISRTHATIAFRDGVFLISDMESVNGVYVNDIKISAGYPLMADDEIRLHTLIMTFQSVYEAQQPVQMPASVPMAYSTTTVTGKAKLIIRNGPQEGQTIPLLLDTLTVGRATTNATCEILLQDRSVSRAHARLERHEDTWMVVDLSSVNGTRVNQTPVNEKGRPLKDGDVITFGETSVEFQSE